MYAWLSCRLRDYMKLPTLSFAHLCRGSRASYLWRAQLFQFCILNFILHGSLLTVRIFSKQVECQISDGVLAMQRQQRQNYSHHQATTFIKQFQGRQEKVLSVHSLPIQRRTNSESCNCNDSREYFVAKKMGCSAAARKLVGVNCDKAAAVFSRGERSSG